MISKVQAYNANQPNFTSTVRVSQRLARRLSENSNKVLKRQIRPLEKNGNNDLVFLDKSSDGDSIDMTVFRKDRNKILENNTWCYFSNVLGSKRGFRLVDLYNRVIEERITSFSESSVSKTLFDYM